VRERQRGKQREKMRKLKRERGWEEDLTGSALCVRETKSKNDWDLME
jgi:hypothetical protein